MVLPLQSIQIYQHLPDIDVHTMALPSRYSSTGLSEEDQHKVLVLGSKRPKKPEYTIRTIEDKIKNAVDNQTYQNYNFMDGDIEMVPIDDDKEVDVISSYIDYSRNYGGLMNMPGEGYLEDDDKMMVEDSHDWEVIEGNISILVLDTNFILSHLKIIDELRELAPEFGLKIVVPIAVMQELDGLKNSTRVASGVGLDDDDDRERISGESVGHLARWANEWIYSSLANSSGIVKGQKLSQRLDRDAVKDDSILDCCMYYKLHYAGALVVLLSNDKNLCLKALSNDVLTVSFRPGMSSKLIASVVYEQNVTTFGKLEMKVSQVTHNSHNNNNNHNHAQPNHSQHPQPSQEWIDSARNVSGLNSFQEVSAKVYQEIQTILLSALHHCMEAEYEEDLELLRDYDKTTIVDLGDCAQVLIRFWFPVFQQYFRALPQKFIPFDETGHGKSLVKKPIFVDEPRDEAELKQFVRFWTTTLQAIYDGVMDETQRKALEVLSERWDKMANSCM